MWISDYVDKPIHNLGLLWYALAGGAAGATTWSIVYPLDVIKCNQQISLDKKNLSILDTAKRMYRANGIRALYGGFSPTVLRSFPANAGLLLGVELTNRLMKHDDDCDM